MSRQFRHRTVGAALVALFAAAPLLGSGPAFAGTAQSSRQVAGGVLTGFPCESRSDVMAVPLESTLQVVDVTGRGAGLQLDGSSRAAIGSTDAAFRRESAALSPQPDCVLGDESSPVLVTVPPSAPPSPTGSAPTPSPSVSTSATTVPVPTRTTTPSATVSAGGPPRRPPSPDAERPTRVTHRPPTAGPSRSVRRPPSRVDADPTRAASRRTDPPRSWTAPADRATTTPPAVAVTTDGMPPGGDAQLLPDAPTLEAPSPTDVAPSAVVAAAEPMAELKPLTRTGGVGLLALIAAVCVTGVMAGAVRTIAAQRASRANMA